MADLMKKKTFLRSSEGALANYDYTDLATGSGFSAWHPTTLQGSTFTDYFLSSNQTPAHTTTGTISPAVEAPFASSPFNLPRTINGDVIVTGYTSGGTGAITGTLYKTSGTVTDGGEGAITWTDATEVGINDATYQLAKTITINSYISKITGQMSKGSGSQVWVKWKFYYGESQYSEVENTTTDPGYTGYTATHANPTKYVYKAELYIKRGAAYTAYEKDTSVYVRTITGYTRTSLGTASTTAITTATYFAFKINITNQLIKKDESLLFEISKTTGSIVCDPTLSIETHRTLKVDIPFKIDT